MAVQKLIRERQQSVWVMLCKEMQQKDISKALDVSEATITFDIKVLQDKSEQSLNLLTKKTLPYMDEKCITYLRD